MTNVPPAAGRKKKKKKRSSLLIDSFAGEWEMLILQSLTAACVRVEEGWRGGTQLIGPRGAFRILVIGRPPRAGGKIEPEVA